MPEAELPAHGIQILNDEQVTERIGVDNKSRAIVPPSTDTVTWYSSGINYIVDGVTYRVERVYAQGNAAGSSLCGAGADVTLFDEKNIEVTGGNPLLSVTSIYAQKAIGFVPVIRWLPYELLFPGADTYTGVVSNTNTVTYAYVGTVCFGYVYPVYEGEAHEELTYISTSFELAGTITNTGVKDGSPYSKSVDLNGIKMTATDYASVDRTIEYYGRSGAQTSFVYSYAFYTKNGEVLYRVQLPQPTAPIYVY